jgi:hypothetical protein
MKKSGFTILLSASVPSAKRSEKYQEDYTKIKNAQLQIDEAVIGLSRNVFQAGGRMVFGGHPSISPLVAMVATEFKINRGVEDIRRNESGEKRISIYQSKAFEKTIPKETTSLFELGYSDIIWTEAVDNEEFNSDSHSPANEQCKKSLHRMRERMIEGDVDALICIGGMDGVEEEFDLFRKLHTHKPVFILQSTGGASKILAERFSNLDVVKIFDRENYANLQQDNVEKKDSQKFDLIPYSFITALIVKEITDSKKG